MKPGIGGFVGRFFRNALACCIGGLSLGDPGLLLAPVAVVSAAVFWRQKKIDSSWPALGCAIILGVIAAGVKTIRGY